MADLISVGLDVGTTTTQLVVSKLSAENRASAFAVPRMEITRREILYQSPIHFTPLIRHELIDGEGIRAIVEQEYRKAGITPETVDTGAVIITGETSRKENAESVLHALSRYAGDFVVATAGPDLESVLAAQGAGAVEASEKCPILHMDIGGGTSNLSFIENGQIVATGCLNVGGRLLKFAENGEITYISPVLAGLCDLHLGEIPTSAQLENITDQLVQALQMAAGLQPAMPLLDKLTTKENIGLWNPRKAEVISFSGGVADCIETTHPPFAFGDLGVALGAAIRKSQLCAGKYRLGDHTIRATVLGAGSHSTQLSGSTIFLGDLPLPQKNLPVVVLSMPITAEKIKNAYAGQDTETVALAFPGYESPTYGQIQELAKTIVSGSGDRPLVICLETDMAKALGNAIRLLAPQRPCLCIDRVKLQRESYLDIGLPVGPALPVVVKTLVLSK